MPFLHFTPIETPYNSIDGNLHTTEAYHHHGIAGEPIPYGVRNDNIVTSLLLLCFVILVVSVSLSREFIWRQVKNFFYLPRDDSFYRETANEIYFSLLLDILACLLSAIASFQYVTDLKVGTLMLDNELQLLGILFVAFFSYQTIRYFVYTFCNFIFFTKRQSNEWMRSLLFIYAIQSMLLFPTVLLFIYFDFSQVTAVHFFSFIFIFTRFLTIYKCWNIFFRQKGTILQLILYFCALEIIPPLCLMGGLLVYTDNLKLNF